MRPEVGNSRYETRAHPNGMRSLCVIDPGLRSFAAALVFRVGFGTNAVVSPSIAHLIEHLTIESCGSEELSRLGSLGLDINGATLHGQILYWASGHRDLQRDGLGFLSGASRPVDPESGLLRRELKVVEREAQLTGRSREEIEWQECVASLCGTPAPARNEIALSSRERREVRSEVLKMSRAALDPARALFVFVGPGDPDFRLLEGEAGSVDVRRIAHPSHGVPRLKRLRIRTATWPVARGHVILSHSLADPGVGSIARLLGQRLGGGPAGAMFRAIRQSDGLSYDIAGDLNFFGGHAVLHFHATTGARHIVRVMDRMEGVLREAVASPMTDDEVRAAIAAHLRQLDLLEADPANLCGAIANHWASSDIEAAWTPDVDRHVFLSMRPDAFREQALALLNPDRRAWMVYGGVGPISRLRLRRRARCLWR